MVSGQQNQCRWKFFWGPVNEIDALYAVECVDFGKVDALYAIECVDFGKVDALYAIQCVDFGKVGICDQTIG